MIISFDTFGAWATAVKEAKQEQEKNITITENGTGSVLPDSGKTLSKVDYTVDVHPKTRLNEEFTENGEYNLTGEWKDGVVYVDVPVKPEREKTCYISKNGVFGQTPDVGTTISKVTINADVHPTEKLTQTITENGTTNLTGEWKDAAITVNVAGGATKVDVGALGMKLGFSTFTKVPDIYDFSNCTDMGSMFNGCTNLTSVPQLDTSKVTYMGNMFDSCSSLTSLPVMDTSKVTDMRYMFNGCTSLTSLPVMDTSKVTYTGNMFKGCTNLTSVPAMDTSKVTDMYSMFQYCTSLTSLTLTGSLNTSLDVHWSPLNEESIKSVLTAAASKTDTTAKTLTFKEGSTFTDDAEGTWAALVADCTTKGWTINNLTITPAA